MARFSRRKALSSLAATVGAATAGLVHLGGSGTATAAATDDMASMKGMDHASAATAGHSGHAGFARGGTVDNEANGFDPSVIVRDFDCGTVTTLADGRTQREWHLVRRRTRDRDRARRASTRPGRSTAASPAPRCAAPRATACGSASRTAARIPHTDPLPRHPPRGHGRRAGSRRGDRRRADRARPVVRLRVRGRAVRAAPLPLPRDAARGAHRQGPLRHVHRRPEGAARRGRRARDGHERVRHELRLRATRSTPSTRSGSTTSTTRSR